MIKTRPFAYAVLAVGVVSCTLYTGSSLFGAPEFCGSLEEKVVDRDTFRFAVWGDPQVAHPEPEHGPKQNARRKAETVNPRLKRTVQLTNKLNPDFVVTVGDNIHGVGQIGHFRKFVELVDPLRMPIYLLMGNHDWAKFARNYDNNPYGKKRFGNFLWAQRQLDGPQLANYSFDAGQWHVVLFSQPGGGGRGINAFFENHPEYLEWLRSDLRENSDRPTVFLTHHPLLPVGRRQMEFYNLDSHNRGRLAEVLTNHGDVRYAFFGHIHNTVGSIPHISWRHEGTSFIMMPNAANTIRGRDYRETAESSWGTGIVKVDGDAVESITFHTLAGERIAIRPEEFNGYDDDVYGFLRSDRDLPAATSIRNGGFEHPLKEGWFLNHLLPFERPPIQERSIRNGTSPEGNHYLRLYTKAGNAKNNGPSYVTAEVRQTLIPGDSMPHPQLHLDYRVPATSYGSPGGCNGYVLVKGFPTGSREEAFVLSYGFGRSFTHYNLRRVPDKRVSELGTDVKLDQWTSRSLNIRADYEEYIDGPDWNELDVDRLTLIFGVYNENYAPVGLPSEFEWQLDDLRIRSAEEPGTPTPGFRERKDAPETLPRAVLKYTFEDADVTDQSGFNNHGKLRAGDFVETPDGTALELKDGEGVHISKSPSLTPENEALTAVATIKTDRPNGVILSRGGKVHGYALLLKEGRPSFVVRRNRKLNTVRADTRVDHNRWVHLAAQLTKDGELKLFVNGELNNTADAGGSLRNNPYRAMSIGSDAHPVGDHPAPFAFSGRILGLTLYRGELDERRINELARKAPVADEN